MFLLNNNHQIKQSTRAKEAICIPSSRLGAEMTTANHQETNPRKWMIHIQNRNLSRVAVRRTSRESRLHPRLHLWLSFLNLSDKA